MGVLIWWFSIVVVVDGVGLQFGCDTGLVLSSGFGASCCLTF